MPSNPFGQPPPSNAFGQPPGTVGGGAFGPPPGSNAFGQPPASNAFGQPAANAFGQPAPQVANPFGGGGPFASAPRSNFTMVRVVLPVVGIVVMLVIVGVVQVIARNAGSSLASGGSTERQVANAVTRTFVNAMSQTGHASELCGFRVLSVANVVVTNVQTSGSSMMGSGFATVSGSPVYMPGVQPIPGPCTGSYSFNYRMSHRWVGRTDYVDTNLDDTKLYRPMQVGGTVNGALLDGDYRMATSGRLLDDYGVTLQAGQTITVIVRGGPSYSMPGQNLDMMVGIVANNTELMSDDDSAGNLNARVVFTAPAAGLYFIRVSTAGRGTQMGTYTVQTMNGANPTAI